MILYANVPTTIDGKNVTRLALAPRILMITFKKYNILNFLVVHI
jgi:hypothetical protein